MRSICHEYMSILLYIYMKLIWCNGFPEIYACLEEGVGSICHGYMSIVLYMSQAPKWVQKRDEIPNFHNKRLFGWMPAGLQTNPGSSSAHVQWFSCQNGGADICDIIK